MRRYADILIDFAGSDVTCLVEYDVDEYGDIGLAKAGVKVGRKIVPLPAELVGMLNENSYVLDDLREIESYREAAE